MKKKMLLVLALLGMVTSVGFADTKKPSESGFSPFNFKGANKGAVLGAAYGFGMGGLRFPLYKTPKAQVTEKQTLDMINRNGGRMGIGLINQGINIGLGNDWKACAKANFRAKSVNLSHYLQGNYGVTLQQAQIKLKEKFTEVKAATLVRFDCPEIQWPREFVMLRTKAQIEKEGLGAILLDYKGVLFTAYPGVRL